MGKFISKHIIIALPLVALLLSGCNRPNNNNKPSGGGEGGGEHIDPPGRYSTIDIYATNDFHGAVEETDGNMGLKKWATYLKNKGENPNTLLIDQGDTWQGSIYSNYNHGESFSWSRS